MKVCFIYCNRNLENIKLRQKQRYREDLELVAKHINANSKLKKQFIFVVKKTKNE